MAEAMPGLQEQKPQEDKENIPVHELWLFRGQIRETGTAGVQDLQEETFKVTAKREKQEIEKMGRMYNTKACECRICGDSFDSIIEGKCHVHVKHEIIYSKTREQLKVMCVE